MALAPVWILPGSSCAAAGNCRLDAAIAAVAAHAAESATAIVQLYT
jgi:hypothetical protein